MIYNINYDIAATFIYTFILIVFCLKKELDKTSNKFFMVLAVLGIITSISDVISSIGNSYIEDFIPTFPEPSIPFIPMAILC